MLSCAKRHLRLLAGTDRVLCEMLLCANRHLRVLAGTNRVCVCVCDMLCCAKRHLRVLAGADHALYDMPYGAKWYLWEIGSTDPVLCEMLSCARRHLRVLAGTNRVLCEMLCWCEQAPAGTGGYWRVLTWCVKRCVVRSGTCGYWWVLTVTGGY